MAYQNYDKLSKYFITESYDNFRKRHEDSEVSSVFFSLELDAPIFSCDLLHFPPLSPGGQFLQAVSLLRYCRSRNRAAGIRQKKKLEYKPAGMSKANTQRCQTTSEGLFGPKPNYCRFLLKQFLGNKTQHATVSNCRFITSRVKEQCSSQCRDQISLLYDGDTLFGSG